VHLLVRWTAPRVNNPPPVLLLELPGEHGPRVVAWEIWLLKRGNLVGLLVRGPLAAPGFTGEGLEL